MPDLALRELTLMPMRRVCCQIGESASSSGYCEWELAQRRWACISRDYWADAFVTMHSISTGGIRMHLSLA